MIKMLCRFVYVLLGWAAVSDAFADPIPGLFNSGVNNSRALLAAGSIDPHYRLIESPTPNQTNAFVLNDGYPINPWLAHGPDSKWIAPQANQATGDAPGNYKYRTTFDLAGLDPTTAVISGRWTSDNAGSAVLINGIVTGITGDGNFGAFGPTFTISSGFVDGTNTLDFVVNNAGTTVNPTGVRIEISGTADLLAPPGTPPSITQQPTSATNGFGESATFTVRVYGSRPFTYQWRRNGGTIANATNATLTLNGLTGQSAGEYDVVVTNPAGSATSTKATLTIVMRSPAELSYEPLGPSSRRTGLIFSEIMYHPKDRTDGRNLEFIELYNSNPFLEDISGYQLTGSVEYTVPPNTKIAGNGYLVIAPIPGDVSAVYGISGVIGGFTNNLPNSAGTLQLRKRSGGIVLNLGYSDEPPWPAATDGAGHSLVMVRPSYGERDPYAWAASAVIGGSPGAADPIPVGALESVMINEILAHTDEPLFDYIELYNHSSLPVDVSGCWLTDERNTNIFQIPAGTIIPGPGFVAFDQNQLGFALSASGETVYFVNPQQTRVIDAVRFSGQANGVSLGRYPDGAASFHELASLTPGAANAPLLIREIVINEIMYNPISGDSDDEYIELYNRSSSAVNVGGWRISDGISFNIPESVSIAAHGYLVIAKNALRLLTNYPSLNGGNLIGNFSGSLANGGERIALSRPEIDISTNELTSAVATNIYYVLVNEVTYRDGGRWSHWADGGGSSLELIDPDSDNRLPANWADSDESAKAPWTSIETSGAMDLGHPSTATSDQLQVFLQGAGEALVDDVEVIPATGGNRLDNGAFNSGLGTWVAQGTQRLSTWGPSEGLGGGGCLRLKASERGDHVANRVRVPFTTAIALNTNTTIRAKVRWLRGHPEILFRLRGGFLEAVGRMQVPSQLGTPGLPNSRLRANAGPAITEVTHRPAVPQAGQAIRVTARADDPDGLASLTLQYRLDPGTEFSPIAMRDDGIEGDLIAGDGVFTAFIPAQSAGVLVGFHIVAADGATPAASSKFPDDAPTRECLVRVGDTILQNAFGTYRFWITQASHAFWASREKMSNEGIDATFVYGTHRVIYNVGGHYSGSSYTAPIYDTPTGALCGYDLEFPDDDVMLGETHLTLDWPIRDITDQREQLMYWFLDQFGLPNMYRRYVNMFVNGVKRGTIYDDVQQPSGETIEEWFPDDSDGNLYKTDCWNEFDNAGNRVDPCILNSLERFTSGGVKKAARYRWNWRPRAVNGTANDFSDLFNLVEAANAQGPAYQSAVEAEVDMEHWMRTFCMNDLASFWDAFGNPNAKNTYLYKPENSGWKLMCWDFDVGLGVFNDPTTDPLFPSNVDPTVLRMYAFPAFIRAYWRAMEEAMNGFFNVGAGTAIDSIMDSKFAAFQANSIALSTPSPIKDWITARRNFILPQMTAMTNAAFRLTTTNRMTLSRNLAVISGMAPVRVQSLFVNGTPYPIIWNNVTNWSVLVPVTAGTNELVISGVDLAGNVIGTQNVTVEFPGVDEAPENALVINEIMYNPAVAEASYIEIYNRSASYSFDVSNWRLNGVGFTFRPGTIITNGQYVVLAKNRGSFMVAYSSSIPLMGQFGGQLDDGGETLTLLRPGGAAGAESVVDQVTYDDDPPWPRDPDGLGASLQLIDAAQDNNRVSNWSDGAGWKFFSYTGLSGATPGARLSLFLTNSGGDVFIDDIAFVEGSVPAFGTNLIANPGFESVALAPWNKTGLATNSVPDSSVAHSGSQSLHLVFAPGAPALTHFYQDLTNVIASGVRGNTTYTLSFWFLPGTNANNSIFQTRLNSLFKTVTDVRAIRYSPGAANPTANPLPAYPAVWLSEVQPQNVSGIQDNFGEREPWIEIYSATGGPLALEDFYLSDNFVNLKQWAFPSSAVLNPGQFLVVWADAEPGETTPAALHTSFRLNPTNGVVALTRVIDGAPQIVDYLQYRDVDADRSFGSFPDGQGSFRGVFFYPSPGGTNNISTPPVPVFINEWMAGNTSAVADPADGDFEDWFELYNASASAIDLSGYSLTDDGSNPRKYMIPSGVSIAPHGFVVVWADEEGSQTRTNGQLHANFKLSASGELIALYEPGGRLVDRVDFGTETNNISHGRFPDGAPPLYFMPAFTPGAANVIPSSQIHLLSIVHTGPGSIELTWTSEPSKVYRVQYKHKLDDAVWQDLAGDVPGNGATASKTDTTVGTVEQRFYQVRQLP